MEEIAHTLTHLLRNLAVYEINGLLVILYALIAQWPLVLSLPCAAGILLLDRLLAVQLSLSPRAAASGSLASTRITLVLIALWIIVALVVPQPVPALGLAMWVVTVLAAWLVPASRPQTVWRGTPRVAMLSYTLANIDLLMQAHKARAATHRDTTQ